MLNSTLPRWLEQIYQNIQICIVDYSSDKPIYPHVKRYATRYHVDLDYNVDHSDAKISLLRVEGQSGFNMSHAINYALKRTTSDVISIAGTESLSVPFYIECAMAAIDHNVFTRCIRGRLTFPRAMIDEVNGYPEAMEYWGAEDDILAWQLQQNGNHIVDLSYLLCHNIHHYDFFCSNKFYGSFHPTHNRDNGLSEFRDINKKQMGSYLNMKRFDLADSKINNGGQEYGNNSPVLFRDNLLESTRQYSQHKITQEWNELHEKYHTAMQKSYYGSRVAVLIPCKNRIENLIESLPQWIDQVYDNKQIVIIDYSSDIPVADQVRELADVFNLSVAVDDYDYDSDIMIFRVNNKEYFNISHAYNYAIQRIQCDVVCTACADSCARDYYLDMCMNIVSDHKLIQCYWGLHTITHDNWRRLNGHQEMIVGWGGEDVDFQLRAKIMGLYPIVLPNHLVFHIPQEQWFKGVHRKVSNISRSFLINDNKLSAYIAEFGHIGNYGYAIGQEEPISDESSGYLSENLSRLYIAAFNDDADVPDTQGDIKFSEEYGLYYVVSKDFWDWTELFDGVNMTMTFLIYDDSDIEKHLYASSKTVSGHNYLDRSPA